MEGEPKVALLAMKEGAGVEKGTTKEAKKDEKAQRSPAARARDEGGKARRGPA